MKYKFYLHQGNAIEGEMTSEDPFNAEWVILKKDNVRVAIHMDWVTHMEITND